jgi:hypothetical protein
MSHSPSWGRPLGTILFTDPGWLGSKPAPAGEPPGESAPASEAWASGGGAGRIGRLDPSHPQAGLVARVDDGPSKLFQDRHE